MLYVDPVSHRTNLCYRTISDNWIHIHKLLLICPLYLTNFVSSVLFHLLLKVSLGCYCAISPIVSRQPAGRSGQLGERRPAGRVMPAG